MIQSKKCFLMALGATVVAANHMTWEQRTSYPGPECHHPIAFANETHGFLLTGSTYAGMIKDFYMCDEENDEWTDLSNTKVLFPELLVAMVW
eukprot:CAMPEP_0178937358 /NCGR_PEP_ID=MMETSP0786-20121207/25706_1 /TAXON_ID=186022 /ORGANISM="Thalassionema frauenfeldii, Strain CCMP 1798" /LENGTH=91 /DNA_ID=CAMNT_0020615907 /DNA_START=165 /DNA_END=437 /DNA_ORIENTATION=+